MFLLDRKKSLLSLLVLGLCVPAFGADFMFVQSKKANLRAQPSGKAGIIETFRRGQKLQVIGKKGIWYEVKGGAHKGWVSRLFLSAHAPVGAAELSKTLPTSLEKDSRRRPASYAVSASTRGLTTSERVRTGRELYRSNFEALERLEKRKLPDSETVNSFLDEGGLQ